MQVIVARYVRGEPIAALAAEYELSQAEVRQRISEAGVRYERRRVATQATHEETARVCRTWQTGLLRHGIDARASERRHRREARHRQALMLALHDAGHSLPAIGAAMGGYDHTTILHGVRRARDDRSLRLAARSIRNGLFAEAARTLQA